MIELYSAQVCPYAHRTRLTLLEKGIDFKLTEIDLNNKPDWFVKISPYQKVPVIKNNQDVIWESAIINEYLEEAFPNPSLFPKDPAKRALARIWIDFANTKFIPTFYKVLLTQELELQNKFKQDLSDHLLFMEKEGIGKLSKDGNYWLGNSLTLVDLTFYPWLERFTVLEHYRGLSLPQECIYLQQWWDNLSKRDSVKSIANPPEFYRERYIRYADNTVTGITAKEMREK